MPTQQPFGKSQFVGAKHAWDLVTAKWNDPLPMCLSWRSNLTTYPIPFVTAKELGHPQGMDGSYYCGVAVLLWNPAISDDKISTGSSKGLINSLAVWLHKGVSLLLKTVCPALRGQGAGPSLPEEQVHQPVDVLWLTQVRACIANTTPAAIFSA